VTDPLGALAAHDGRPAVIEPGRGRVSYAELDALADRVASRLLQMRLGADARIGLYLNRSSDAVAAMLVELRSVFE
jgi:acyl-CoA synthetase (AMP-forming)/AMP-acid ligase II